MDSYSLSYKSSVKKDFKTLPKDRELVRQIQGSITALMSDPFPYGCKKLKKYRKLYRISVAEDYRIIYKVSTREKAIEVYRIRHRSNAYRDLEE